MTPQQHANAVRDALQNACDQANDARNSGVLLQWTLGPASDGKMSVLQFSAFTEMKLNN